MWDRVTLRQAGDVILEMDETAAAEAAEAAGAEAEFDGDHGACDGDWPVYVGGGIVPEGAVPARACVVAAWQEYFRLFEKCYHRWCRSQKLVTTSVEGRPWDTSAWKAHL